METVKNIAAGVSIAAVVIGAIHILIPNGKMTKQMRYIAGLLLIIAVVSPFAGASFELDFHVSDTKMQIGAEGMLTNQVTHIVGELLRQNEIDFKFIEPSMDISPEGDISIYRIYVAGASDADAAAQLIRENFPECEVDVDAK